MKFKISILFLFAVASVAVVNAQPVHKTNIWDIFGYEDEVGEHHHLENSFLDWFHDPAEGVTQGFDLRFRTILADNFLTLDDRVDGHRWDFQRYRLRWWQKWMLDEDVDFNWRLVWETRTWAEPGSKPQSWEMDEILFDRLNLTFRNMFDLPLTMVVGRQDIILGNGWLVLDGTPLDGSRTIFLDALRFTYEMEESDSTLDAIFIKQSAASDQWLKPINDQDKYLTEQDETGVILWLTNKSIENTKLEAFYIYKKDNKLKGSTSQFPISAWSRDAEIHTFGGAVSGNIDENWLYRVDGAIQTGDRESRSSTTMHDLEAYGAKGYIGYQFNDEHKNEVHAEYEFLSGDDPGTGDDEAFDPLWGEWPQFTELYIYTYSKENAIGETTNLQRAAVGHSFKPNKKLTVETDYHLLWAHENTQPAGALFDGGNNFRGQLLTCWLKYSCCKQLKAHLLGEYFIPGNYYISTKQDPAFFLRFNIEYSF